LICDFIEIKVRERDAHYHSVTFYLIGEWKCCYCELVFGSMAFKLINWENTPYICVYNVPKDIFLKCNKLFIHQIPH
jgi:hypothetical protein